MWVDCEHIAGDVKKSVNEVDALILQMRISGTDPQLPMPLSGKSRNAYKKVLGLRTRRAPIFWAIGPAGYNVVFRVEHRPDGTIILMPDDEEILAFETYAL